MCYSPILVKKVGDILKDGRLVTENIWAGCGKCAPCKLKRVNDWIFRLMIEEKNNLGNYFVTITYDTHQVPISKNGFLTLRKTDLQEYIGNLKKLNPEPIKYYAVGEYGESRVYGRPHYHLILFNIQEERYIFESWMRNDNPKEIYNDWESWQKNGTPIGDVHVGHVTQESVAYVCKYVDKDKKIPLHKRDDRQKEFPLMSHGIGKDYMSPAMLQYHADYIRNSQYTNNGYERPLPRYFREKIWTEEQREEIRLDVQMQHDNRETEKEKAFYKKYPNGDYQKHLYHEREASEIRRKAKQKLKPRNKI